MGNGILNSLKIFMVVIGIGLLSAFVLSCDGSSSSEGGGGGGSQTLTITGESGNQVNLNGTWESACVDDIEDGNSDMDVMTASGSTFTQVRKGWSSISCPGTPDTNITAVGTVVLGDDITVMGEGSNVTATEVDGVFSSYVATCNSADVADELNDEKACGFDDWTVGIPKDLLGSDCVPDSDFKDVVYINDTVDPNTWHMGNDEDLDANGYPTGLENDMAMYRM